MLYHIFGNDDEFKESLEKIIQFYQPNLIQSQESIRRGSYCLYETENNRWISMDFPFIDKFHEFFQQKYSEKKNLNHFINVVAALARLIQFFDQPKNVKLLFRIDNHKPDSTDR